MRILVALALSMLVAGSQAAYAQTTSTRPPPPTAPALIVSAGGPYVELMPAGSEPPAQGQLVLVRFPTTPGNFAPGDAGAQEACARFNYGSWKAWGGVDGTNRLAWVICNISSR